MDFFDPAHIPTICMFYILHTLLTTKYPTLMNFIYKMYVLALHAFIYGSFMVHI